MFTWDPVHLVHNTEGHVADLAFHLLHMKDIYKNE